MEERIIAVCKETGKVVLMELGKKCICLHRDTREEELKDIQDFLKEFS